MAHWARPLLTSIMTAGLLLLVAACSGSPGEPTKEAPVNQPASEYMPRIIPQFGHGSPISAVAWINDGRNLVSIDSGKEIIIWDVEERLILDRAQVPLYGSSTIYRMEQQGNPRELALIFTVHEPHPDLPITVEDICPGEALRENLWCTFTLDLETREVRPDGSVTFPDTPWMELDIDPSSYLPRSPDGQWQPEPFRNVDKPELVDPDYHIAHVPEEDEFPGIDCASLNRCDYGIALNPVSGQGQPIGLAGDNRSFVTDLDISSDGRRLVQINSFITSVRAWSTVVSTNLATFEEEAAIGNNLDYAKVDWMPLIEAATSVPVSSGSSDRYSKVRPLRGSRIRLAPPASSTLKPLARASAPIIAPPW